MDTDDLSNEAYQGIIVEAEDFNHDLTLQFGMLASDCTDEEDYLDKALQFISELRTLDKDELMDVFFDNVPEIKSLHSTLDRIAKNINQVRKIPKEKRQYDF